MTTVNQERVEQARQRVAEIRGFYTYVAAYIIVNLTLFTIDMLTDGDAWFFWPLLGMSIGLAAYAFKVFGPAHRFGAEWEERKVQEILQSSRR